MNDDDKVVPLDEEKRKTELEKLQEVNRKTKEREAEERKEHNEKILKQYRIKRK